MHNNTDEVTHPLAPTLTLTLTLALTLALALLLLLFLLLLLLRIVWLLNPPLPPTLPRRHMLRRSRRRFEACRHTNRFVWRRKPSNCPGYHATWHPNAVSVSILILALGFRCCC